MPSMLTTKSGAEIPKLILTPELIIDRTLAIYGPSGTGKTVISKSLMETVRDFIDVAILISPTEPSNGSYARFIDKTCIHYRLYLPDPKDKKDTPAKAAMRFLETIWARQEMLAAIYTRANALAPLASLYKRLDRSSQKDGNVAIATFERRRRRIIKNLRTDPNIKPDVCEEKIKEVESRSKKILAKLYKNFLIPNIKKLWGKKNLSEDERYSLQYLELNPRLLLIFDDCAAELKPFFNKDIFRKLFYQNRHSYITVIICCQDDTDLPTNLRKNAFVSVFTSPIVCTSNFERGSNKFPKSTKNYVNEIVDDVFQGHRKLAYIREDSKQQHFYHLTCPTPRTRLFGSPALHDLCKLVRSNKITMDKKNPYYEKFRV